MVYPETGRPPSAERRTCKLEPGSAFEPGSFDPFWFIDDAKLPFF